MALSIASVDDDGLPATAKAAILVSWEDSSKLSSCKVGLESLLRFCVVGDMRILRYSSATRAKALFCAVASRRFATRFRGIGGILDRLSRG